MPSGDLTLKVQTLYSDHQRWLLGWLRRRVGHADVAADLTHDTYVRVLQTGRTPEPEQSRAHLAQIAKGLVIDLHRRRLLETAYLEALAHLPPSLAPSAEQQALLIEELLMVDRALAALPARVRAVFLMSQLDGLTYSQIADRMGISFATVRKYMLRTIQSLHAVMQG